MNITTRNSESDLGCLREMDADVYRIAGLHLNTIVDIGANIGCFSLLAASLNPDAAIRAYEPEPDNFRLLQENLAANNAGNVEAFNIAVCNTMAMVHVHPGQGLSHVCPGYPCTVTPAYQGAAVECLSVTLDDALAEFDTVDMLKVDCEGSEFEIFGGASPETMAKIRRLRMEIHDYRGPDELEKLRNLLARWLTLEEIDFTPSRGGYWFGDQ